MRTFIRQWNQMNNDHPVIKPRTCRSCWQNQGPDHPFKQCLIKNRESLRKQQERKSTIERFLNKNAATSIKTNCRQYATIFGESYADKDCQVQQQVQIKQQFTYIRKALGLNYTLVTAIKPLPTKLSHRPQPDKAAKPRRTFTPLSVESLIAYSKYRSNNYRWCASFSK